MKNGQNTSHEEKRTILIADDAFANRAQLQRVFSDDYTVLLAENGRQALDVLYAQEEISALVLDIMMPVLDGYGVLREMQTDERLKRIPVIVVTASSDEDTQIAALDHGAQDVITKPISPKIILHRVANIIGRMDAVRLENENRLYEQRLYLSETDEKTGLLNKQSFCARTRERLQADRGVSYVICRWDIDNFKVYNDVFGVAAGDRLLRTIADGMRKTRVDGLVSTGHLEADHFVTCITRETFETLRVADKLAESIRGLRDDFDLVVRVGVFAIDDVELDVSLMCDRALLALRSIKYNYSKRVAWYEESMRSAMLEEQELLNDMESALEGGQFHAYYQPQYDHSTGLLIGAEALVRWVHPEKGVIPPGVFIPIFERNGFINKLDEYIWEQVCASLRGWLDAGMQPVPVSVNISRIDIYNPALPAVLVGLIKKYGLEVSMLRLEITESAYMDAPEQLISAISRLKELGFVVEMDDFGSGYSSLNTLKEVPVDILKLDMKFLESGKNDSRSGRILSSVLRMANWIDLPVLAEGVETKQQADYLVSMSCSQMQGYYFARPMPKDEYERLLGGAAVSAAVSAAMAEPSVETLHPIDFLDASTQATQMFNSFMGGAQIVEYDGSSVTVLRVNDSFLECMGFTRAEYTPLMSDTLPRFDEASRELLIASLLEACHTGRIVSCELRSRPIREGAPWQWTLNKIRLLSRRNNKCVFYLLIENINERKELDEVRRRMEDIVRNVPAGVGIYECGEQLQPVYLSDKACALFGYTREEYDKRIAAGEPMHFSPNLSSLTPEQRRELETGTTRLVYLAKKKDDSRFWLRVMASLVKREDGPPLIYATLTDVSEEKAAAEELEFLIEAMPGGIFKYAADETERITYISSSMLRMLGYTREEFAEQFHDRFSLMVYEEDRERVLREIGEQTAHAGDQDSCEYRIRAKDGSLKWVYDAGRLIEDAEGRKWFYVIVADNPVRNERSKTNLKKEGGF